MPQNEGGNIKNILLKMNTQLRVELLTSWMPRYAKTYSKKKKGEIIDFLMESTGYKNRKTVIRLMKHGWKGEQKKRRGRPKILERRDRQLLGRIWLMMGQPCGKRMAAQLPEWMPHMECELGIRAEERERLLRISAATIDRELRTGKIKGGKKRGGKGSMGNLKKSIPLIDPTRRITQPGHLYADTVAHSGESMRGDFAWTLTVTDDYTLWTWNRAVWNKGQYGVCCALANIFAHLPMPKRDINTDNGAEFINYHIQKWLTQKYKRCKVTRSRPYKKNDNARAEERNRHKVRELVGYERYDEPRCVRLLNKVYKYHNLLVNHFYTSTRLISKQRDVASGKVRRRYDKEQTPYERLIKSLDPEEMRYKKLVEEHAMLNPVDLSKKVEAAMKELFTYMEEVRKEEKARWED